MSHGNRWLPRPLQVQPDLKPLFLLHLASPTSGVCAEPLTPCLRVQKYSLPGPFVLISWPASGMKLASGPHPGVQSPAQFRDPDSVPGAADTENKTLSLHAGSQDSGCPCHLSGSPNLFRCWDLSRGRGLGSPLWVLPPPAISSAPHPPTPSGDSVTTWGALGSW